MQKKFKLKSLYLVVLADTYCNKKGIKYKVRKNEPIFAYSKNSIFNPCVIKYFINILDKTKYFERKTYLESLCVIRYCPISAFFDKSDIERGYVTYDIIEKYLKCNFTNNFITETENIFEEIIQEEKKSFEKEQNEKQIKEKKEQNNYILDCGNILTNETFIFEPTIGREEEINKIYLALASLTTNPILVGELGVGKTVLADELAYKIQRDEVPEFLKGKRIIELSAGEITAGTKYRGTMEERIIAISKYAKKNNAIIFIDDFHKIFASGKTEDSQVDIASMLKKIIDRDKIKVIGATSKANYYNLCSTSDLKDKFSIIDISEPNDTLLYEIISYKFDCYSKITTISIDNINSNIIKILIELTAAKHRKYNDKTNNPSLVIDIIDKAFSAAIIKKSPNLTYAHIIMSIEANERIYESAKEKAIRDIINLKIEQKEEKKKKY